jgi:hypothetical protein
MSVLDKINLLNEPHSDFEKPLDADAQKVLEHYDEIDAKKQRVLDWRYAALNERVKKFEEIEAVINRLTNLNLPSSEDLQRLSEMDP